MSGSNTRDLVSGLWKPRRGKASPATKKKSQGVIRPKVGKGVYVPTTGGGGGIASPLTETSRTYYQEDQIVYSSDGLFVFKFSPVHLLNMKDAGGQKVQFIFRDPNEEQA
jgi:hypothetical protein